GVPLTSMLNTLPCGPNHREDLERGDSVAQRLAELARDSSKPCVAVVDSGALYDPMVRTLEEQGLPVFRSADRALMLLNVYCRENARAYDRMKIPAPMAS
ncbi:MAG: hypothetical protein PHX83_02535, partial [Acidobacteriia bacterium]|nr:hypothetical protein [Terriglobia bacterium]